MLDLNFKLNLDIGSWLISFQNQEEKAVNISLRGCSFEDKKLIREFFIHDQHGEKELWLPQDNVEVASLLQKGILNHLGGQKANFKYGTLRRFKLGSIPKKVLLDLSTTRYGYKHDRAGPKHCLPFSHWSQVTFKVRCWASDASMRYRFQTLYDLAIVEEGGVYNPTSLYSRPDFFYGQGSHANNGNPVKNIYELALQNIEDSGNCTRRGMMPPKLFKPIHRFL